MTTVFSFFFLALGAILASFACVVADRLSTGQSWVHGRSHCNACGRVLCSRDLFPVVSWLIARGKCRVCGARISADYVYAELVLAFLFLVSYHTLGLTLVLVPFLFSLVALLAIVRYDLRHMIVPPALSAPFVLLASCVAFLSASDTGILALVFAEAGCIAFFLFLIVALSRGKAMGQGDPPIAYGLALLAGSSAIAGLVFSFWVGAVVGILILFGRRKGHRMGIEVPFVPFMALGFLLAYFTQWNPFLF